MVGIPLFLWPSQLMPEPRSDPVPQGNGACRLKISDRGELTPIQKRHGRQLRFLWMIIESGLTLRRIYQPSELFPLNSSITRR